MSDDTFKQVQPRRSFKDPQATPADPDSPSHLQRLWIYSHSPLVYWWPVWIVGYVMALITYWQGFPKDRKRNESQSLVSQKSPTNAE